MVNLESWCNKIEISDIKEFDINKELEKILLINLVNVSLNYLRFDDFYFKLKFVKSLKSDGELIKYWRSCFLFLMRYCLSFNLIGCCRVLFNEELSL